MMARAWLWRSAPRIGLLGLALLIDAGAAGAQTTVDHRDTLYVLSTKKSSATLPLPTRAPRIVVDDEGVQVDGQALVGPEAKSAAELAPLRTYLVS